MTENIVFNYTKNQNEISIIKGILENYIKRFKYKKIIETTKKNLVKKILNNNKIVELLTDHSNQEDFNAIIKYVLELNNENNKTEIFTQIFNSEKLTNILTNSVHNDQYNQIINDILNFKDENCKLNVSKCIFANNTIPTKLTKNQSNTIKQMTEIKIIANNIILNNKYENDFLNKLQNTFNNYVQITESINLYEK